MKKELKKQIEDFMLENRNAYCRIIKTIDYFKDFIFKQDGQHTKDGEEIKLFILKTDVNLNKKYIERTIFNFIAENYGIEEAKNPCYDLKKMAQYIDSKLYPKM